MNEVLILSSDPVFRQKNSDALTEAGFEVVIASDLVQGMLKIDKESFDIIVIDEELPDADNYLACRRIRHSSNTPIILLGSETDEDVWNRVEELGFDFYLKKPVNPRELVARVKAVLRWAKAVGKQVPVQEEKLTEVPEVLVAPREAEIPVQPVPGYILVSEEIPVKIWQNIKVTKLINSLVMGKLTEISPEIDLSLKDGFTYPEADKILETSGRETAQILESLTEEGILHKHPFVKLLLSPEGSVEINPVEHCPHCDSNNLMKGQIVEHFTCGYIGLEGDFRMGLKYICPKCKQELKLIGTDCRNLGTRYQCRSCHEIFTKPVTKFRCSRTGESYTRAELKEVWVNAYCFNEGKKDWLEFELGPKAQLIDFLKRRGYEVNESAKVTGKSGVTHTVDILAIKDDAAARHIIGIDILVAKPGETEVAIEELFDFETKANDTGIHDKVIIAIPELSPETKKFAQRRGIRVFHTQDLRILSLGQPQIIPETEAARD